MNCRVYRSRRVDDLYVFLRDDTTPEHLPPDLRRLTGPLDLAMELALTPQRTLARSDVATVIAALRSDGYYVQMPENPLRPRLHRGD